MTDKLRSYVVAYRESIPDTIHSAQQYEDNWAEQSRKATRVRELGILSLNQLGRRGDFWEFMLRSHIYPIWEGTWLELNITVVSGSLRSVSGVGWLPELERASLVSFKAGSFLLVCRLFCN